MWPSWVEWSELFANEASDNPTRYSLEMSTGGKRIDTGLLRAY